MRKAAGTQICKKIGKVHESSRQGDKDNFPPSRQRTEDHGTTSLRWVHSPMQRHHRHQDVPNTPRDASIRPTHPSTHVNVVPSVTPGPVSRFGVDRCLPEEDSGAQPVHLRDFTDPYSRPIQSPSGGHGNAGGYAGGSRRVGSTGSRRQAGVRGGRRHGTRVKKTSGWYGHRLGHLRRQRADRREGGG